MENKFIELVQSHHRKGEQNLEQLSALEIIRIALLYFDVYNIRNNKIDNIKKIITIMEKLIENDTDKSSADSFLKDFIIHSLNHTFFEIADAFAKGGAK